MGINPLRILGEQGTIILNIMSRFFFLTILLFGIATYSYMNAAWTAPSGTPPTNNVDAPINTGLSSQAKAGALDVGSLSTGAMLVTGDIRLDQGSPSMMLNDTDAGEKAFWVQANANSLYVLADRDNSITNPDYSSDSPWPLQIYTGATTSQDFATFSNEIRATQYCNRVGGSCATPAEIVAETSKTWGNRCTRQTINATKAVVTFTCPANEYLVDTMCSDEGSDADCTLTKAGYGGSFTRGGGSNDGGMSILCCKD